MKTSNRLHTIPVVMCLCLGLAGTALAEPGAPRVFIFGDSLSDAGNIHALTGETAKAPYAPIPSAPYAIGGHHFSNGRTWAEKLAQSLNDTNGGKPSREKPGQYGNYAHGGARARVIAGSFVPSSSQQVDQFLADFHGAPPDALYVIQFGGNDLRDALVAGATNPSAVDQILTAAIGELMVSINRLYAGGARRFLVASVPSIEHAPVVRLSGASSIAAFLVGVFNGHLEGMLQWQELVLPEIDIRRLDMADFVNDVVADPAAFGISNVLAPCLSFLVEADAKCSDPDQYLFWDGLHPTKVVHAALANRALIVL